MWLFPGWSALMCTRLCVELTHCGGHTIRSEGLWSLNTPHKWCTAHSSPLELWPPRETDKQTERECADEEIISVFIAIRLMREGWSTWQLIRLILFSKHSRVCVVVSVYDTETELVCDTCASLCMHAYVHVCSGEPFQSSSVWQPPIELLQEKSAMHAGTPDQVAVAAVLWLTDDLTNQWDAKKQKDRPSACIFHMYESVDYSVWTEHVQKDLSAAM